MPLSLIPSLRALAAAALVAAPALTAAPALAESAYVSQMTAGVAVPVRLIGGGTAAPTSVAAPAAVAASGAPHGYTPEMAAARGMTSQLAQTLQIGSMNSVAHIQVGAGNISTAAVIGQANNLSVLQAGSNLQSNVVLLGTQGLNVGVIQPPGSIPVNMLIARLPNGGLLIKR
ncbi:hypothetical protein [Methylobacterium aerolatum]|uniref:Uncharacterized protein n=1 Tax=Methylobacterium aerolatum TaxID=418708 RepID=A0ABU0HUT2_9HYPH|nr:hypothetical protein [Methylobacterium aerolatum]MDQ0446092.1 hypothetical protein [Methylobacterium aerolatum]GJD35128.1 hypothetical protein FMGBMHLM_2036 [Methylobacterium aerolatum]